MPTEHQRALRSGAVKLVSTCETSAFAFLILTSPPQSSDHTDPVRSFVCAAAASEPSRSPHFSLEVGQILRATGEKLGCLFASAALPHYDS